MILGIDVGGTNTDAVILHGDRRLVAKAKVATTADVTTGIQEAMKAVIANSGVHPSTIESFMLGTTHCINAILERRGLDRVAVIRLGAPATKAVRPLFDWPGDLRRAIRHRTYLVQGGHEFDGRLIARLDRARLRTIAHQLQGAVDAVAITSVFSPVTPVQELEARDILVDVLGDSVTVSLSHEVATIGLLERENATVLNAALGTVSRTAVGAFGVAAKALGLRARLFLGQNDGTLMSAEAALRFPILTVASGPTNSIRGAAYLAGVEDAIVVDVGGTSTDIGLLKGGFPMESSQAVDVGDVRTNFRMPDVLSLAMGGGSRIQFDGRPQVGPDSVGYRLTAEARVFGGDTLTVTDVAVGVGRCQIGDRGLLADLSRSLLMAADDAIQERIEVGIDKVRIAPDALPVVIVGGGAVLLRDRFQGTASVIRPDHYDVANAIGVAIAEVGADVDTILAFGSTARADGIARVSQQAIDAAIAAGADAGRTRIASMEEIPVTYLPGNAVRIRIKACGPLTTLPSEREVA